MYLKLLKERSSSQRKQLFRTIQMRENVNPVQLLLDMKVRWSSTHVMLKRVLSRRFVSTTFPFVIYKILTFRTQSVDTFVYEMGCIAGGESIEKCRKIDSLRLTGGEWARVQTFEKLLAVCSHLFIFLSSTLLTLVCRQPTRLSKLSRIPPFLHYRMPYR